MNYYLPAKIPGYLLRLSHHYAGDADNATLKSLIDVARVYVDEGIHYDNWDGGTYGHDVRLYLPLEALAAISPKQQEKLTETLTSDLRGIAPQRPGEFISTVGFELNDENDADFQRAVSICDKRVVSPDVLTIWKPSFVRKSKRKSKGSASIIQSHTNTSTMHPITMPTATHTARAHRPSRCAVRLNQGTHLITPGNT